MATTRKTFRTNILSSSVLVHSRHVLPCLARCAVRCLSLPAQSFTRRPDCRVALTFARALARLPTLSFAYMTLIGFPVCFSSPCSLTCCSKALKGAVTCFCERQCPGLHKEVGVVRGRPRCRRCVAETRPQQPRPWVAMPNSATASCRASRPPPYACTSGLARYPPCES